MERKAFNLLLGRIKLSREGERERDRDPSAWTDVFQFFQGVRTWDNRELDR